MDNGRSLLDSKIATFYKTDCDVKFQDGLEKYFNDNNTYEWQEIGKLFHCELKIRVNSSFDAFIADFASLKYCNFKAIVKKLYPIFVKSSEVVECITNDLFHFQWLGQNGYALQDLIKDTNISKPGTSNVERVLLLTAMLEYGLGNVYYTKTKGRNPPHLLRDLLSTEELVEVFGWEAICFLKILLGTPHAINLRNIVWHGFPQPAEISQHYVAVLIVIINTLGHAISGQDFKLKRRPQVTELTRYMVKIESFLPQTDDQPGAVNAALSLCEWLDSAHKAFWKQLLWYMERRNYWQFVVLALPQIELLLRLIYAQVNDYDVRAKLDEYYITMDTIFEPYVPAADKRLNMLLQPGSKGLNESCLKLMYDLFVAPHGPRIRDKVSHGEATLTCINNATLCHILLHLANQLLCSSDHYQKMNNLTHYESLYHLNSMASQSMACAKSGLLSLHQLASSEHTSFFSDDSLENGIKIFHRPKNEAELMQILLKISQFITQICANYMDSINERRKLLQQRELHSKRRRTFERMLEAMPAIYLTLYSILDTLIRIYRDLQEQNYAREIYTTEDVEKTRRFLKQTLKIVENFLKYSFKESNEWIKALELCTKFQSHHKHCFE